MSYQLPHPATLAAAVDTAETQRDAAPGYHARVMCTVTAAAVRDALTDFAPGAAFDAVALELVHHDGGVGGISATGTYWTAAGERQRITDSSHLDGLAEWTCELNSLNRSGWQPLCAPAGGNATGRIFRLDLVRAAELPTDADLAAAQRRRTPGHLAIADAIRTGGSGLARLTIRYVHQWHLTEASAELVYLGQGRFGIGGFQQEAFTAVTELAETALKQGAAALDLTTEHPGSITRTVQRLKFNADRGTEVDWSYSTTALSPS
jgi:hypothetical protein